MSEPARLLLSEATYPEQGVRQVLGASLPDHKAPASEQNTPCLLDSYAWGGSPCTSVANYPAVSQALCISTCKLHFLWERRGQAEGRGKRRWEFAPCPPKEKGVAEVDEGGPDLNEARAYRNAWKTRKPGSLCMGEALSSAEREGRGRRGWGKMTTGRGCSAWGYAFFQGAAGKGEGDAEGILPFSHHDPCWHHDLFSTSHK